MSFYINAALKFDPKDDTKDTPCECGHLEYNDEVIVREDGFTTCIPCDIALTGFEIIFGDSIDEMEVFV